MSLVTCPDCANQVSSEAVACPHCGYPIQAHFAELAPPPAAPAESGLIEAAPTPLPASAQRLRPLSYGLSATVAAFLWACLGLYALAAAGFFAYFGAWSDWVGEGSTGLGDLLDVEAFAVGAQGFAYLAYAVTAVLFMIWFFQAYAAARSLGATGRRWGTGWTIGSWFIPFANLAIPKLVMNELDRMANPEAGPPPTEDRWKLMRRSALSDWWWTLWLSGIVLITIALMLQSSSPVGEDGYGRGLLIQALAMALYAAAAGLAAGLVLRIGRWLREPAARLPSRVPPSPH